MNSLATDMKGINVWTVVFKSEPDEDGQRKANLEDICVCVGAVSTKRNKVSTTDWTKD